MPSPDTSAQGAPVASQGAAEPITGGTAVDGSKQGYLDQTLATLDELRWRLTQQRLTRQRDYWPTLATADLDGLISNASICAAKAYEDAYAAGRASERERYAELVAAVMEWRDAFESQSGSSFVERIERLETAELALLAVAAALAALEEAGSA